MHRWYSLFFRWVSLMLLAYLVCGTLFFIFFGLAQWHTCRMVLNLMNFSDAARRFLLDAPTPSRCAAADIRFTICCRTRTAVHSSSCSLPGLTSRAERLLRCTRCPSPFVNCCLFLQQSQLSIPARISLPPEECEASQQASLTRLDGGL